MLRPAPALPLPQGTIRFLAADRARRHSASSPVFTDDFFFFFFFFFFFLFIHYTRVRPI